MSKDQEAAKETVFAGLPKFHAATPLYQWMFDLIRRRLKGRILEIGSGLGDLAAVFIKNEIRIHLSDPEDPFCQSLFEKFHETPIIRRIHKIDFHDSNFEKTYPDIFGVFDTVLSLNLTEHPPCDSAVISHAKSLLPQRGRLIVLFPTYIALYNESIQDLEEWEDYNTTCIKKLLGEDIGVLDINYFRLVGGENSMPFKQPGLFALVVCRKL